MRRPTRPQRPALAASKLIVHRLQGVCKCFFACFYRQFCVFVWFVYSCIVIVHNDRFFVCWCCRLRELNRRRRVRRFKRRCACGCVVGWLACLRAFLPRLAALYCRPPLPLPFARLPLLQLPAAWSCTAALPRCLPLRCRRCCRCLNRCRAAAVA